MMKFENVATKTTLICSMPMLRVRGQARQRQSLADELQWKLGKKSLKLGIKRHAGFYQLRNRHHASIPKSTGYHGNHWEVDADNLELETRQLTAQAVDEAVMKQRDQLVRVETAHQLLAAERLADLNKEFMKTVRLSQKHHNKEHMKQCGQYHEQNSMVLEELLHYHHANMVEELAEVERERRVSLIDQVTAGDKNPEGQAALRDLATINEKMDAVRACLMSACRIAKVEINELEREVRDEVRDLKDQAMREMLWKEQKNSLYNEMELAREHMIVDRTFIYNDEYQMRQFHSFQLVMKELPLSFERASEQERVGKERNELAINDAKEKLLEELAFWYVRLNRWNTFKACASEKSRRIRRAEAERLTPPDIKAQQAIQALHEEMVLDYFNGRRLLTTKKTISVPNLPTYHDMTLYQIRTRARVRTPVVARRHTLIVED